MFFFVLSFCRVLFFLFFSPGGDKFQPFDEGMYTHLSIIGEGTAHVVPRHPVTINGQPVHRTHDQVLEFLKKELAAESRNGRAIWMRTRLIAKCTSLAEAKRTKLFPKSCTNDKKRKEHWKKCQKAVEEWERSVGKDGNCSTICAFYFLVVCVLMLLFFCWDFFFLICRCVERGGT